MSTQHQAEICYLALTRPALTLGVPLIGLIVNAGACFFGGMLLSDHSWWHSPFMYWAAAVPVHLAMRRLTSWDFHFFRTLMLWILTTGIGIVALNILATQRVRTVRGVSSSG
jgi:type IV secretory pathway VirB3-like protein